MPEHDDDDLRRRREQSPYGKAGVIPDRLALAIAAAPLLTEAQVDDVLSTGSQRVTLTTSELAVVLLLSHGLTPRQIAETLQKSLETIRSQIKTATARTQAETTVHLIAQALRAGDIE